MSSTNNFHNFSNLVYDRLGIYVEDKKKEMFEMKLQKVMRRKSISSYEEYFRMISNVHNKDEFQEFVNVITTNTTEFFRERAHFDFIIDNLQGIMNSNPRIMANQEIRIWSAGCSSGQEPVTLAMVLSEHMNKEIQTHILATDISSKVLAKALGGKYTTQECEGIPQYYKLKYMEKSDDGFKVNANIMQKITYRSFNLMDPFKFNKGFDVIFCRNVMIYFNTKIQQKLVTKFYEQLVPGGLFFMGHSESLINKKHQFHNKAPSLYMK